MIRVFDLLLLCSIIGTVCAGPRPSIDEAIVKSEETSNDAQMHQADGNLLVELDMRFTQEQWAQIQDLENGNGIRKRNALRNLQSRWTNGVVPYQLPSGINQIGLDNIKEGINEWNKYSCLNIRPKKSSDKYYINIIARGGCSSMVGMTRVQGQMMTLGRGCLHIGVVAHEFGHALGFHHEQTRPDRDEHVRILKENVYPNMLYNFKKYNWQMINNYSIPYDYESVMHYGTTAFSRNRKMTIQTLDPKYQSVIGQSIGVSFLDIKLINLMYNCNKKCPKKTCPGNGFVGKDCKCWCKGPSSRKTAVYCDTKKDIEGTGPIVPLRDHHSSCPYWAKRGECKKNPGYMLSTCRKSCNNASSGNNNNNNNNNNNGEVDNNSNCPYWAKQGECKRNPGYMLKNCKKSCKNFNSGNNNNNSGEVDNNSNCPYWAKRGECTRNPGYMLRNCRKSCKAVGAL